MRYVIIVLFFVFINLNLAYATTYIYRGEYRDFIDYNITGDIKNCVMFNTKVINETKYFLICDGSGVYVVARFDELGVLEVQDTISRQYQTVFSPTNLQVANIVYIPCIVGGVASVCKFNISRYVENISDALSYRSLGVSMGVLVMILYMLDIFRLVLLFLGTYTHLNMLI